MDFDLTVYVVEGATGFDGQSVVSVTCQFCDGILEFNEPSLDYLMGVVEEHEATAHR